MSTWCNTLIVYQSILARILRRFFHRKRFSLGRGEMQSWSPVQRAMNYANPESPEGNRMQDVEIGVGPITQVRFGGPDSRDLYINTVSPQGGAALKDGEAVAGKASHLYRMRSDIRGMAFGASKFWLR